MDSSICIMLEAISGEYSPTLVLVNEGWKVTEGGKLPGFELLITTVTGCLVTKPTWWMDGLPLHPGSQFQGGT